LIVGRWEIWETDGTAWFTQWVKWNSREKCPAISRNINSSQRSLCGFCGLWKHSSILPNGSGEPADPARIISGCLMRDSIRTLTRRAVGC
jgi:hypothetical protein